MAIRDEPHITLTLAQRQLRRQRLFIARAVRALSSLLGLSRPGPALAWTRVALERLEDAIALDLQMDPREKPLSVLLGHQVFQGQRPSWSALYQRYRLVHQVRRELERLDGDQGLHGWKIACVPSFPAKLWCCHVALPDPDNREPDGTVMDLENFLSRLVLLDFSGHHVPDPTPREQIRALLEPSRASNLAHSP